MDELLLQDANNLYKPILGVCFGAQIMNVWHSGSLLQQLTVMPVNHAASRSVGVAHTASIAPGSLLATIIDPAESVDPAEFQLEGKLLRIPVNSSHHQAIGIAGDGLVVSARCAQDGVVEAIEARRAANASLEVYTSNHFLLGVQWHPERTFTSSPSSRRLFERLIGEAARWTPRKVLTSIAAVGPGAI